VTEDISKTDSTKTKHTTQKKHKTQQNKTTLVQSLLMTLGQQTRWAYCTTLPSPLGAIWFFRSNPSGKVLKIILNCVRN